jgi:hypothetical protein
MRSIVGVGMTPPKVLGTPKPASSVMINSTFGAPFGGTTRGAHQGFDDSASCVITPPNFGSGGGSCFPLMVVVALGEPSVPVTCCAAADCRHAVMIRRDSNALTGRQKFIVFLPLHAQGYFAARRVCHTTNRRLTKNPLGQLYGLVPIRYPPD